MSKSVQPDPSTTRLEARVVQLQSQVSLLEQKLIDQQHQFNQDLNLMKQQLATLFLLQQGGNIANIPVIAASTPKIHLSVVDLIQYSKVKQKSPTDFFARIFETCSAIENSYRQQLRVVEDLSTLNPILGHSFAKEYQTFLLAVASKADYSPPTILVNFLSAIGFPLYNAGSSPTLEATTFYPLGSFMYTQVSTETQTFVPFSGLSKFHTLASILSTYPLSLHTSDPDQLLPTLFGLLSLNIRVDYHLISALTHFKSTPQSDYAQSVRALYNYLLHRSNDFSNTTDPKQTFFELYYFMVFILHAIHYASQHLEVFTLRHPVVNFMLGDEQLMDTKLFLGLVDPLFLQLSQDIHDYNSFCAIFKQKLNDVDSHQPIAYHNKPQQYLRLSTNGDIISQYKWPVLIAKQLSKELAL